MRSPLARQPDAADSFLDNQPCSLLPGGERPPGKSEALSWLLVGLCAGAIFATIPLAARAAGALESAFGKPAITLALALLAAAPLAAILRALMGCGRTGPAGYLWFAGVASLLIALITWLKSQYPAESFHYLECGLLGFLLFRALSHRVRDAGVYAFAVVIGTMIGTADEPVQWLTPGRYFKFADIALNAAGVALAQALLAGAVRPAIISGWPGPEGLRRLGWLAAGLLALLGLCFALPG